MPNLNRVFLIGNHTRDPAVVARFWTKVSKVANGCWEWKGSVDGGGYGQFSIYGRGNGNEKAHRFSFVMAGGTLSEGDEVCHRCDNRRCVRPEHLFKGSHLDNMIDAQHKGRMRTASKGKPGSSNHQAKLRESDIPEIIRFRKTMSQTEVAMQFGVDRSSISLIERRKRWKTACLT